MGGGGLKVVPGEEGRAGDRDTDPDRAAPLKANEARDRVPPRLSPAATRSVENISSLLLHYYLVWVLQAVLPQGEAA